MQRKDLEKCFKNNSCFSIKRDLSARQQINICKVIAPEIVENDIIAFYDNGLLGKKGKSGILFAKNAIYYDFNHTKIPFENLVGFSYVKKSGTSLDASFTYKDGHTETYFFAIKDITAFVEPIQKIIELLNDPTKATAPAKKKSNKKSDTKSDNQSVSKSETTSPVPTPDQPIDPIDVDKLVDLAFEYYKTEDYEKCYTCAFQASSAGNHYAHTLLGILYEEGRFVKQDTDEALFWYKKAAASNYPLAVMCVAKTYFSKKLYSEAFSWYQKAADLGNPTSENNLGYMYQSGLGVAQDYEKAFFWYQKAADHNISDACLNISRFYENGIVVEKDIQKAIEYLNKAAQLGDKDAAKKLKELTATPEPVETINSSTDLDVPDSIDWDHIDPLELDELYLEAMCLDDDKKAFPLLLKCAEMEYSDAYLQVANYYYNGTIFPADYAKAKYWYEKAVDYEPKKSYYLGILYLNGHGVKKDTNKAMEYFAKSVRAKDYIGMSYIFEFCNDQSLTYEEVQKLLSFCRRYMSNSTLAKSPFKEYVKKYELLLQSLNPNNASKIIDAAESYLEKGYVYRSYSPASSAYEKAASLGHLGSIEQICKYFIRRNEIASVSPYVKILERSQTPLSLTILGEYYVQTQNPDKGFPLLVKAVNQGDKLAQIKLILHILDGKYKASDSLLKTLDKGTDEMVGYTFCELSEATYFKWKDYIKRLLSDTDLFLLANKLSAYGRHETAYEYYLTIAKGLPMLCESDGFSRTLSEILERTKDDTVKYKGSYLCRFLEPAMHFKLSKYSLESGKKAFQDKKYDEAYKYLSASYDYMAKNNRSKLSSFYDESVIETSATIIGHMLFYENYEIPRKRGDLGQHDKDYWLNVASKYDGNIAFYLYQHNPNSLTSVLYLTDAAKLGHKEAKKILEQKKR